MSGRRPAPNARPDQIGLRVRRLRLSRNLSQRVPADLASLTQGYTAQIELDITPLHKRSTQLTLVKALKVSPSDLTEQPYDPSTLELITAAPLVSFADIRRLLASLAHCHLAA